MPGFLRMILAFLHPKWCDQSTPSAKKEPSLHQPYADGLQASASSSMTRPCKQSERRLTEQIGSPFTRRKYNCLKLRHRDP
jgi:hypothetical protein